MQEWTYLHDMETNEAHIHFINKLNSIINKIAPEKEFKLSRKKSPKEKWMTKGLLKSTLTKEKLYKKTINKDKTHLSYETYTKYRNKYNSLKRIIKAKYYTDALESSKYDMKNTWNIMKSAMNKLNNKSNI